MKLFKRLLTSILLLIVSLGLGCVLATIGAGIYFAPGLPDVRQLQGFELQTPLRVYTRDDKLIGEFGAQRRMPVSYDDIPQSYVNALLAAEDASFFEHPGIDPKGLARAALELATTGSIQSGGSTITMQVARNYLLTLDQTFTRKIREILLSLQMEQVLSKQDILELYVNKIYLGNGAYGIGAAAKSYYDKPLAQLDLPQLAMLAGLPKAPSALNPLSNPERSLIRRNWVLLRMRELGFIDPIQYQAAVKAPITANQAHSQYEVNAPYVAEMARQYAVNRFGDNAYTDNIKITTTIDSRLQTLARNALVNGLIEYDTRHGWRGPEKTDIPSSLVEAQENTTSRGLEKELSESPEVMKTARQAAKSSEQTIEGVDGDVSNWLKVLDRTPTLGPLKPGIVVSTDGRQMRVLTRDEGVVTLGWDGLDWAREYHSAEWRGKVPANASAIAQRGDLVRVMQTDDGDWRLSQIPGAQAAIVIMDPQTGAIRGLQGGFNFSASKFNRAIQAKRQAGSIFKPFIYLAALHNGMSAATIINDAPVVMSDMGGKWRPENAEGEFRGPTRLRVGLYESRNLVTIRVLQSLGLDNTLTFLEKFGFSKQQLPHGLSLALGSASLTPLEMANAYAVLANGGFKVSPWYIQSVTKGSQNKLVEEANPVVACRECAPDQETVALNGETRRIAERVANPEEMYIIRDMMRDVIEKGTGRGALDLNRADIVGKTGTTNDQRDAWFSGFNSDLVATVWVGKDDNTTTGEYGSQAALPIWKSFMGQALQGRPESMPSRPDDIVKVRIDPATGLRLHNDQPGGMQEIFRENNLPDYKPRSIQPELEDSSGSQGTGTYDAIF
ncbi:penicillin-binding protein 1A [Chromohalobacter marismortui]|uniref:Penicillin-binding protein 1A n=1 Tax=Chromohalobacter marismortui TaxID=42055 RepID=A0A4R7NSY9_9GAMM|nr:MULTISPECIES: penicillin-binding protein 1A [Chromohalobacter]MCI0509100.1 penicillin-binding protein 1A [Chromohalobacter sp.]MCI0592767.1 penicillin-binding protein 1A [Chromohalobacter sp.]TDU24008.1 penicillin-binding protein 1A [Chromohalobacter marismortui]